MTIIVFKDGVLAADTQVNSSNGCPCGDVDKIGRLPDGSAWAFSGDLQRQEKLVAWAKGDRHDDPPVHKEGQGVFILISPDGVVREWWGEGWLQTRASMFAWGSGERPARAAMIAGADAALAVEIAVALDSDCGSYVQSLVVGAPPMEAEDQPAEEPSEHEQEAASCAPFALGHDDPHHVQETWRERLGLS